jgi:hypothetical protein
MNSTSALRLRIELAWWLITLLVASLILLPILLYLPDYKFLWPNLAFIIIFVTLVRYIFQLRYSFLAPLRNFKVAVIFACFITSFLLIQEINLFQTYLDENGMEAVVGSLSKDLQGPMMSYIHSEMLLFGVGAVISCLILPLRLILSIWRRWNGYPD